MCIRLLTLRCLACKRPQKDRDEQIDAGQNTPKACWIPLAPKKGNELKHGALLKLLLSLSIEAKIARYNFSLRFHFLTKKARKNGGKYTRSIRPNSKSREENLPKMT